MTTHIAQLPAFGVARTSGTEVEPRRPADAARPTDSSRPRCGSPALAKGAERSDEELMDGFRLGDADAFTILVTRHSRGLYNFLLRSVHAPARAEELLQEVLLRVIRSKDRYRRSARFTTWVYTIARNLCVDESRRARFRDHESLDAPLRRRRGSAATLGSTLASEALSLDLVAESPRVRERLQAAVQRLPGDQREVFLMRLMAGMSFREIGETVGAPENTVKSRMRYALDKLREELADLRPAVCSGALEEATHG